MITKYELPYSINFERQEIQEIFQLPEEIILNIFKTLSVPEKANIALTCKRCWLQLEKADFNPAIIHFTIYFVKELISAGHYTWMFKQSTSRHPTQVFEKQMNEWFPKLSGKMPQDEVMLKFITIDLSQKRNWTEFQIKKLCKMFIYKVERPVVQSNEKGEING